MCVSKFDKGVWLHFYKGLLAGFYLYSHKQKPYNTHHKTGVCDGRRPMVGKWNSKVDAGVLYCILFTYYE